MTPAETALTAWVDAHPPRKVQHPDTGCKCGPCWTRDGRLEALAEDRAAARRGDYAGPAENRVGRMAGRPMTPFDCADCSALGSEPCPECSAELDYIAWADDPDLDATYAKEAGL